MVSETVKKLVIDTLNPLIPEIGHRYITDDGRLIEIEDGKFWGTSGVSNFWYWREVLEDGTLSEVKEHGYGIQLKEIKEWIKIQVPSPLVLYKGE